jgi:hypothetical protein
MSRIFASTLLIISLFFVNISAVQASTEPYWVDYTFSLSDKIVVSDSTGLNQHIVEYGIGCLSFYEGEQVLINKGGSFLDGIGDTLIVDEDNNCKIWHAESVNLKTYVVQDSLSTEDLILITDSAGNDYGVEYGVGCIMFDPGDSVGIDIGGTLLDGIGDTIYQEDGDECRARRAEPITTTTSPLVTYLPSQEDSSSDSSSDNTDDSQSNSDDGSNADMDKNSSSNTSDSENQEDSSKEKEGSSDSDTNSDKKSSSNESKNENSSSEKFSDNDQENTSNKDSEHSSTPSSDKEQTDNKPQKENTSQEKPSSTSPEENSPENTSDNQRNTSKEEQKNASREVNANVSPSSTVQHADNFSSETSYSPVARGANRPHVIDAKAKTPQVIYTTKNKEEHVLASIRKTFVSSMETVMSKIL